MKPGDEAAAAGSGSGDGAVAPPAGWGLPYRVLLSLGSLALTALMLLSVSDALLRSFLNAPLFGAQEVARMLLVATVAFGIPAATIVGQTISIDILTERLSPSHARVLAKAMQVLAALVMAIVAWRCLLNGFAAARFGEATVLLALPYGPFYHCLALGFALAALASLTQAVRN